ncbi:MAG: hypothetical protein HXX18_05930 [Bacteroidetes bacterium]|nr:hypothetical protein [Bacteroidota bacterium]
MKSWLEEIEEQEQKQEALSERARKRIQVKKEKAAANYKQNGNKFDTFISKLNIFVKKVNSLPEEERAEFIEIDARLKETEFDNKLTVFSSSKRVSIRKMRYFFFGKEVFRFKHIRVIYFSISKEMGKIDIEYKEKYLPKGHREKYTSKESHFLYELDFDILTEELAYRIINWLAFKEGEAEFTLKQS